MVTINEQAPVVANEEIEIAADRAIVWEVLTSIEEWPRWNPEVKEAIISTGEVSEGAEFRWRSDMGTLVSTIVRIAPPHLLAWKSKAFGLTGVQVSWLEPAGAGTIVRAEEAWDGLRARLLRRRLRQAVTEAVDARLHRLKVEAERRAGES